MVEKEDNQIKITIFGQEYSVKAPADPTYIKNIAEYVDTKMREVQSGFSSTQSSNRIAILSAMNITDELFAQKANQKKLIDTVEAKTLAISEFVEGKIDEMDGICWGNVGKMTTFDVSKSNSNF